MADDDRPQIYLVTPPELDLDLFPDRLAAVLDTAEIACLRLALASRDETTSPALPMRCARIAHARDIPIVIERHVQLVTRLGLDGVHLTDGARHPHLAQGSGRRCDHRGPLRHHPPRRHFNAAEAGADYVSFGPVGVTTLGDGRQAEAELFEWWSDMIEVPVVAEGALTPELVARFAPNTDFFAFSEEIWLQDDPAAALRGLIAAMG
jgi:thiamine-phosphate pyrophosphorylase